MIEDSEESRRSRRATAGDEPRPARDIDSLERRLDSLEVRVSALEERPEHELGEAGA